MYDNNEATLQFNVDVETQEMTTLAVSIPVILLHFDITYVAVERKLPAPRCYPSQVNYASSLRWC